MRDDTDVIVTNYPDSNTIFNGEPVEGKVCAVVRTDVIATGGGRRSRQMTPR